MKKKLEPMSLDAAVQIEAAATDSKGPAKFSMEAYTGAPIKQKMLDHLIVLDLDGINIRSQQIPARYHHNALEGVGHTTKIEVRGGSLWAEGVISRDTEAAREVLASAKNGFPWQASVGLTVTRAEFLSAGAKATVNGTVHTGPMYIGRTSDLDELSFVDLGADRNSSAAIAAAANTNGEIEIMDPLAPKVETPVTEPAKVVIEAAAPPSPTGMEATLEKAKIESDRRTAITVTAAAVLDENPHAVAEIRVLAEAAMNARDYSSEKFALEAYRVANTYAGVSRPRRSDTRQDTLVIEAALCMAGGMAEELTIKAFGEEVLETADKRFRNNIGLVETIGIAAQAAGFTGRIGKGNIEEMMQYAFPIGIQAAAGQSTISLPGILSNVANKFLRSGFDSVEDAWRMIATISSVNDFKTMTSHALTGDMTYKKIGPGGELKHGSLGEETYSNKAETYGRIMGISYQDLVNDNLGALTSAFKKLGRGGHLKLNLVVWAEFLNNAAFFTAGRKNYKTGANTVLGIDGYTLAEKTFNDQKDPDGNPLGSTASILLVPNGLSADADVLMASKDVHGSGEKTPTNNPHRGKAKVVRSSYLNQAGVTGSSDLAWYLLANPLDLPVLDVCFLHGKQRPTVERTQANFNTLGIDMRGFFNFGAALTEYRGGVKMKGEA